MVDEFPDVSFYVLNEPAMTSPEPDEIGVWQELAQLRTENLAWRECVQAIAVDADRFRRGPREALAAAIQQRLAQLGTRVARIHHPTD